MNRAEIEQENEKMKARVIEMARSDPEYAWAIIEASSDVAAKMTIELRGWQILAVLEFLAILSLVIR